MAGLIEKGKEIMGEDGADAVSEAALIAVAQKVEHYEIATYGCLITPMPGCWTARTRCCC
jgi:ferritin-like metal-binding protein YciE